MKSLKAAIACLSQALVLPLIINGAAVAQVVSEEPDGAVYTRGGTRNVDVGVDLMEGDILESSNSTLILSLCEGSLLTVYPNSVLHVTGLGYGSVTLRLVNGEILGDASMDCTFTVETKVGRATISNGVYGIVHSEVGEDWTLQVRNLDGNVSFVGDLSLDTSNITTSLLVPGEEVQIPAGEEIIVRGVYNEASGVFSVNPEGAAIAALNAQTEGNLREGSQYMSSVYRSFEQGEETDDDDDDDEEEDEEEEPPYIIEIPFDEIETASDKG